MKHLRFPLVTAWFIRSAMRGGLEPALTRAETRSHLPQAKLEEISADCSARDLSHTPRQRCYDFSEVISKGLIHSRNSRELSTNQGFFSSAARGDVTSLLAALVRRFWLERKRQRHLNLPRAADGVDSLA